MALKVDHHNAKFMTETITLQKLRRKWWYVENYLECAIGDNQAEKQDITNRQRAAALQ